MLVEFGQVEEPPGKEYWLLPAHSSTSDRCSARIPDIVLAVGRRRGSNRHLRGQCRKRGVLLPISWAQGLHDMGFTRLFGGLVNGCAARRKAQFCPGNTRRVMWLGGQVLLSIIC